MDMEERVPAGRVRSSDSLSNRRNHEFMLNHAKMGPAAPPSVRPRPVESGRGGGRRPRQGQPDTKILEIPNPDKCRYTRR